MVIEKNTAAIFTWCYDIGKTNYGQILQCYALQELCKQHGIKPTVMKYRALREDELLELIPAKGAERERYERNIKDRYTEDQSDPRVQRFLSFIDEYIYRSARCYCTEDVKEECGNKEYLIVGSDQLWNPDGFDRIMLLEFADDTQHCFTYATGGVAVDWKKYRNTFRLIADGLDRFEQVSVREPVSVEILGKYTDREIVDVLDPTLMLTEKDWDQVCGSQLLSGRYIFCYCIGGISFHKHVLKEIAKFHGVDTVLYIKSNHHMERINGEGLFYEINDAGPSEFLSLIKYAEAVCTDSFHGFALSIVYQKEFYLMNRAFVNREWASTGRMDNVIHKLGIGKRYANCKRDVKEIEPIHYDTAYKQYQVWKQYSERYLRKALHLL